MNKQYIPLFLVILTCLVCSLLYIPPVDLFTDDKEIFRYAGFAMSRGAIPYKSFFDHKPPLIYFFNYAGYNLGSYGLWFLDTILVLSATLFFYNTCKKNRMAWPWLLPILFNLILRDYRICTGVGATREYTAIIALVFFCTVIGNPRFKYVWLGILTGLTFFTQQEQVLILIPFWLYSVWSDYRFPRRPDRNPTLARTPAAAPTNILVQILQTIGGFLAVAAPIIAWFAAKHALKEFWSDAFLFNFQWYTAEKKSFIDHFRAIRTALENTGLLMVFVTVLILGIAALVLNTRRTRLILAALIALAASLSQEFLSGQLSDWQSFAYYFLPLAATIPILAFTVFAYAEDNVFKNSISQLIYGALLSFMLTYDMAQHATHLNRADKDGLEAMPAFAYLNAHPPTDYNLYIVGHASYFYYYNRFNVLIPSYWIYQHFWNFFPAWDRDQRQLHAIQDDLLHHHTTYILDVTSPDYFQHQEDYQAWLSFLAKNYEQVPLPPGPPSNQWNCNLWKIKDAQR